MKEFFQCELEEEKLLIGVAFPITDENVTKIDGFQLYKAHEMFRSYLLEERKFGALGIESENAKQFLSIRKEMLRRLTKED